MMLFICGQSFISGGEYALKNLILHLDHKEKVYLICPNNPEIKKFFEMPNVVIIECPYFQTLTYLKKKYSFGGYVIKIFSTLSFLIFFAKLISKIKPKIVISNNFSEIPASLVAYMFQIPFIQYVHEIVLSHSRNYKAINLFKRFISKFIFVSNESKNAVSSILPQNKFAVISNSVDLYNNITVKEISTSPLKVLFIGMINNNKNPMRFLNWVKILSEEYQVQAKMIYHLYEIDLLNECQSFAQTHNLNVEWIKNPEQNKITDHMNSSHFLCSTSFYEAQPLTVLHALSLGTPIITSQNLGVPEIISDGFTGITINDDAELMKKIRPYIQSDNYKKMSEKCHLESLKYSHKKRIDSFLDVSNNI